MTDSQIAVVLLLIFFLVSLVSIRLPAPTNSIFFFTDSRVGVSHFGDLCV